MAAVDLKVVFAGTNTMGTWACQVFYEDGSTTPSGWPHRKHANGYGIDRDTAIRRALEKIDAADQFAAAAAMAHSRDGLGR